MPLFDYKCKQCGIEEEHIVKDYMQEVICKKCSIPMRRAIGAPSFRLYGEGFYKSNKR